MTVPILHVLNNPKGGPNRQVQTRRVQLRKGGQCLYRLAGALNVSGIVPIMVVLRAAVGFEKIGLVVPQPVLEILAPALISGRVNIMLETVEVVAGVKVIDPLELGLFGVPPCAAGQLA